MNFQERLRLKLPMDRYVAIELLIGGIYALGWIMGSLLFNKYRDVFIIMGSIFLLMQFSFEVVELFRRYLFMHLALLIFKTFLFVYIAFIFVSTFTNWELVVVYEFAGKIRIMLIVFLSVGLISILLQLKGKLKKRALG